MQGTLLLAAIAALVQAPPRFAQVTFVSGGQIYVSAGREHGVAEGMELVVLRGDTVAATLRVQFVSSRQAACVVTQGATDVAAGDRVRYLPVAADSTPSAAAPPPSAAEPRRARRRPGSPGLHGRLSSRYTLSQVGGTGSLAQPGLDARVTGVGLGGTPLGVVADVRGRSWRSSLAGGQGSELVTDVYQLALLWHQPGAPLRLAVGRQYLTAVSSIVLLDGALVELNRRNVSAGLFGGAEPAFGDSTAAAVRDLGGYLQFRSTPGKAPGRSWAFTLGAAGSYAAGQPNREFGFAQLNIISRAFTLYASQQLDYYRGDKVAAGEQALSLTSGYVSATLRAGRALTFDAGLDDRRNVRLWRDLQDPLAVFDDSYRQAAWGGASWSGGRLRLRVEGRGSSGGAAGTSSAVTASAGVDRLPHGLGVWGRVTRYRSAQIYGWLGALRVGVDPTAALHVEASGGLRHETDPPAAFGVRSTFWYGAEANLSAGRAWYAVLSLNREAGPDGALTQAYASVSWRF
jgi:hypothetical protein